MVALASPRVAVALPSVGRWAVAELSVVIPSPALEQAVVEHLLDLLSFARHFQPLPLTLLQRSLHLIELGQLGLDLLLLLQSCQLLLLDLLLAASSFTANLEKVTTVAIRD